MAPRWVKGRKFEQESVEAALVSMLVINELPFSVVEQAEFKKAMETEFPGFRIPSLEAISTNCAQLFMDKKLKLKSFIKQTHQRACLTLDTWKSNHSVNYLCISAHFIDNYWNLHKKIIGFSPICSDSGEEIGRVVEKCLQDWEISNVLAISAGDGSSYDAAISYLGTKLPNPVLDGKFLRLRCFTDLATFLIKEVLQDYASTITRVRAAVKYVTQSPSMLRNFTQRAKEHNRPHEPVLSLDRPSSWTSTFMMLWISEKSEIVFNWYRDNDPNYVDELRSSCGVPGYADWEKIRNVLYFLYHFYESSVKLLCSHVTSHIFLDKISSTDSHLDNWGKSSAVSEKRSLQALELNWKYIEYWGDIDNPNVENANLLIYVASILNPLHKTGCMERYFRNNKYRHEYTDEGGPLWEKKAELVVSATYDLFNEYVGQMGAPYQPARFQTSGYMSYLYDDTPRGLFQKREVGFGGNLECKTEIDIYLNEEENFGDCGEVDILLWWKCNSEIFPILSKMAKDVLAIPASASGAPFIIGGRLLDDFQSSLSLPMVEALICTQDWMKNPKEKITVEEGSAKLLADKMLKGIYEELKCATLLQVGAGKAVFLICKSRWSGTFSVYGLV